MLKMFAFLNDLITFTYILNIILRLPVVIKIIQHFWDGTKSVGFQTITVRSEPGRYDLASGARYNLFF